ncbi:MAG: hypothetical protein ACJ798_07700 [Phenylobacterium sp.]
MLAHIFPWFGIALTVTVCAGAFWKGGREEQLAAGGLLLSFAVTLAMRDRTWAGTQWGALGADICLFILLAAIALRTKRYWPLAAAAFQLLCVLTHVARMIDPGVRAWAYATGQVIWSQMVFWALGVGVWNTWRRQVREDAPA